MPRRKIATLFLTLTLGLALLMPGPAATPAAPPLAQAVEAIGITVSNMERAIAFYTKILFFEKVSDLEIAGDAVERLHGVGGLRLRVVRLRLGEELIELSEPLTPRGRPIPSDSRSNDRWFQHIAIIVSDMDQAYLWLRRHQVRHLSPAPQRLPDWNPNAGGIRAFYFADPDGHPLEILQFPPDKGDPRWQRPGHQVFLGIDHTAIVVADTEASLALYRDALGMTVVGRSENWGPEQERLNNVSGARLRITTLRASAGPGIELLEYLTPRDGRLTPGDIRATDLVHWQTLLAVRDAPTAARALGTGRLTLVSPGVVRTADERVGFREGFVLRDPDGHALQLRAR
ncbi:MAG TPA: VOC family protein [Methylomirabilota bacterium]|nr:VOC family protein [Methylomirabilota bacterium]